MATVGAPTAPILECRDLHAYYGRSHILRGVTLAIHPGEAVGLMGRNGMGKTTLIRSLLGLVPATSGEVRLDGRSIHGRRTCEIARAGIAYVPEGRGIFSSLSVAENLSIVTPARAAVSSDGWTLARVLELFPRLAQRLANRGDQLSGGEQQMLAIARALLTNPRLLILDEATEGLAPLIRSEIWRTLRFIRDDGIATLIVDKTVSEVSALADRVVVLVKGHVMLDAPPAVFLADPTLMHRHLGV